MQRKERNEMMSLLDRPDNHNRHAAKLWQTHVIKSKTVEIKVDFHHKLHN